LCPELLSARRNRPRAWPYTVSAAPVKPFPVSVFSFRHFDFSSSVTDTAGFISFSFPEKQCQCLMLVFFLREPVRFPVSPAADGGALCAGREQLKVDSKGSPVNSGILARGVSSLKKFRSSGEWRVNS
jgi:hypothetical protein